MLKLFMIGNQNQNQKSKSGGNPGKKPALFVSRWDTEGPAKEKSDAGANVCGVERLLRCRRVRFRERPRADPKQPRRPDAIGGLSTRTHRNRVFRK